VIELECSAPTVWKAVLNHCALSLYPRVVALFIGLVVLLLGCTTETEQAKKTLVFFHAGSLAQPLREIERVYEKDHADLDIQREASGSRVAAKKISELKRDCDIIAVADYTVIEELLMPEHCGWLVRFATNAMVLAYTKESKYADEINSENWCHILMREDVEWGHSDPDADPCGYRSIQVLQLAEHYYAEPGLFEKMIATRKKKNIRPRSVELVSLLKSRDMDYAFEYRSVAVQYGLQFVELPAKVNLGDFSEAGFYSQAQVKLADGTIKTGKPILYGITIPKNAPNRSAAVDLVRYILVEGQDTFREMGQPPLQPATATEFARVPAAIRTIIKKAQQE